MSLIFLYIGDLTLSTSLRWSSSPERSPRGVSRPHICKKSFVCRLLVGLDTPRQEYAGLLDQRARYSSSHRRLAQRAAPINPPFIPSSARTNSTFLTGTTWTRLFTVFTIGRSSKSPARLTP